MNAAYEGFIGSPAGAPSLPGAKCRGTTIFDEAEPGENPATVTARHAQALNLCLRCPSLGPCQEWFASLTPARRPRGVIAGRIHTPTRRQKATE